MLRYKVIWRYIGFGDFVYFVVSFYLFFGATMNGKLDIPYEESFISFKISTSPTNQHIKNSFSKVAHVPLGMCVGKVGPVGGPPSAWCNGPP